MLAKSARCRSCCMYVVAFFRLRSFIGFLLVTQREGTFVRGQEVQTERCTLCPGGANFSKPEYAIHGIPEVPAGTTCGDLANLLSLSFASNSDECQETHGLLSTLCGCPVDTAYLANNPCTLCDEVNKQALQPDNSALQASSQLFDNVIPEPTCEIVQAYLTASQIALDSDICLTAMRISKYSQCCGDLNERSNSTLNTSNNTGTASTTAGDDQPQPTATTQQCMLCKSGDPIMYPDKLILTKPATFPTCGDAAVAVSLLSANDQQCYDAQAVFGIYCGCPNVFLAEQDECPICKNGNMTKPDVILNAVAHQFQGLAPSCALYESMLKLAEKGTESCDYGAPIGIECGCDPVENHCTICPDDGGISDDHYHDLIFGLRCELFEYSQFYSKADSYACFFAKEAAHICGCRDGVWHYAGAETRTQQALLAWLPRLTALLSILGSMAILKDIIGGLRKKKKKKKNAFSIYHQIMVGVSTSDLISSSAHILTSLPVPRGSVPEMDAYGAKGTEATCTAQGLFLTLGLLTSAWYNLSLCIYYKLVILNGWREATFTRRIRLLLLGTPAGIGMVLAAAGIPHYSSNTVHCSIAIIPWYKNRNVILGIVLIPLSSVVLAVTILTTYTFYKFRQQLKASNKWKFSTRAEMTRSSGTTAVTSRRSSNNLTSDQQEQFSRLGLCRSMSACWPISWFVDFKRNLFEGSLEGQVLRQSAFYLLAFYGSIPIVIVTTVLTASLIDPYPLILFSLLVAPIQGFNNALIFFRPRVIASWNDRRKKRAESLRQSSSTAADATRRKFLITHFFRRSSSTQPPSDASNLGASGGFDEIDELEVIVGSFRLPSQRGSQLWKATHEETDVAERTPEGDTEREKTVTLGGYRLPNRRGSQLWEATHEPADSENSYQSDGGIDEEIEHHRRGSQLNWVEEAVKSSHLDSHGR